MKRKILKISLVGKTNAGKSTLLNNLVGEKISITNKKINTTEDFVIGIVNIKNTQLVLYDTPGISFLRDNKSQKTKLKKNLWEGLNQSDIILYLIDSKRIELNDLKNDFPKLYELKKNISIIFNKTDLIKAENLLKHIKLITEKYKIEKFFNISADILKNFSILYFSVINFICLSKFSAFIKSVLLKIIEIFFFNS